MKSFVSVVKNSTEQSKPFGHVFFSCGCSINLANITKSKISNKFTCLVHNTSITKVKKLCKFCKKPIEFKNILQITNREFCTVRCAKHYHNQIRMQYEENPPERKIDCEYYSECLIDKSKIFGENYDLGCEKCSSYKFNAHWLQE